MVLRRSLQGLFCEQISLANRVSGERFHLIQSLEGFDAFDRTHIFEIGIDGGASGMSEVWTTPKRLRCL